MKKITLLITFLASTITQLGYAYTTTDTSGRVIGLMTCEHNSSYVRILVNIQQPNGSYKHLVLHPTESGTSYTSQVRKSAYSSLLAAHMGEKDVLVKYRDAENALYCGVNVTGLITAVQLGSF